MGEQPELLTMSQKEIKRLEVLQWVSSQQISQVEAAKKLGLSTRQVRRLQASYKMHGAQGLISKRRGKASPRRLSESLKNEALKLLRSDYEGFGPTLAQEKLRMHHGLNVSVETLRQWMIGAKLWQGKRRKKRTVYQQRARRACLGELIQMDGSYHDWFEGRAPACCLLVLIDDATSRLMHLQFVSRETTEHYFDALEAYFKAHGRPLSLYTDRHSIFRINLPEAQDSTGETQLGRALRALDIELICARTPQAKGRVERANQTLQDRLVKEMRLQGIQSMEQANLFLMQFKEDYNQRFAIQPQNPCNVHRQSLPEEAVLHRILSIQQTRILSKNLELSYKNVIYQIQSTSPAYTLSKAQVTVCERRHQVTLLYKNKVLPYKTFDPKNRPAPIVEAKDLVLRARVKVKPKANHPWRHFIL